MAETTQGDIQRLHERAALVRSVSVFDKPLAAENLLTTSVKIITDLWQRVVHLEALVADMRDRDSGHG